MSKKYYSDELVLPGETILEMMEEYGLTQRELAVRMDYTPKHINEVIKGKSQITVEFAMRLESVFGLKSNFWVNLESNYREQLVRINENDQLKIEEAIAREIPYAHMAKLSWVPTTRKISEKVSNLRSFFRVSKLTQIKSVYDCAFREKSKDNSSSYAQAAWIARGEQIAASIDVSSFSRKKLNDSIDDFRKMTLMSPDEFIPQMIELCSNIGIALAFVPILPKTFAHGATKWISKDKVLIQLSLRYKYADIFWFSFFHELSHLLLHGKKIPYIEKNSELEIEADELASELLIPNEEYLTFVKENEISYKSISDFSSKLNVHTGILVGRLMHDKVIDFHDFHDLRVKYEWRKEGA